MKLEGGNLFQDKEPTPTEPQPIKLKDNWVEMNGKKIDIKCDRKIKRIFCECGKWFVEFEEEENDNN